MIKPIAATLLLSFASLSAHAASTWRCDYIYEGDIADSHYVEANSQSQAMQRTREWAAGQNFLIDRFLGCRPA
ncbi:hypothetical protein ABB28_11020 [Stenotrophomonas chelatiphaga]|uniref:Secreted protein n=1 Tax=Stenotrophomonas chelatiphaga TaxID=517011 RepID=A0A0R0CUA3_9GAMM|nr:hypothetical protein [Stenotrophomonas chelatiphaga]KRG73389.1 hypothetical protein ABB28_11020 [Stenotrophomonas chelatiphaga]MCS4232367.1 hypothetical protein [Stenotrophomonas chelatiphaga]ROQ43766.1 hypothetical protein EDF77_1530 [Stenotrophomonas maltophilia]